MVALERQAALHEPIANVSLAIEGKDRAAQATPLIPIEWLLKRTFSGFGGLHSRETPQAASEIPKRLRDL